MKPATLKGKKCKVCAALSLWTMNLLLALDLFANALMLGSPYETISSRAGRYRDVCVPCDWLCWLLDKIDKKHCSGAADAYRRLNVVERDILGDRK